VTITSTLGNNLGNKKSARGYPMRSITKVTAAVLVASAASCGGSPERGSKSAADTGGLVGNPAPDFQVKTVTGSKATVSLKSLHGQVVLLDFWGTFCEPCKKSFPKLEALQRKYAGSGLRVVGISEDEDEDKDKIPGFADTYGAKFAVGWDADKAIARKYKPETMPSSFVIDKEGVVRFAHVGFHDGEEADIDREIRGLLGD
jgi:cytochrome c biogenesis protein CcmG/thiol:disulfide interchange protein DsbE